MRQSRAASSSASPTRRGRSTGTKKNLIDQTDGEDALNFPFKLSDNETLTQRQIARLYRIYPPGPMRDRRIFGKWIATQGLVYPFYEDAVVNPPKDEQPYRHSISIDHADSSVTHAIRYDWYKSGIWAAAEWRHDGRTADEGTLKDVTQAQRIQTQAGSATGTSPTGTATRRRLSLPWNLGNMIGRRVTPALERRDVGHGKDGAVDGRWYGFYIGGVWVFSSRVGKLRLG